MHTICSMLLLFVVSVSGLSDFEALLELRKGIQEDPLGRILPSWDAKALSSDGCPKNWYGITCSGGYVTSIDFNDLGLVGNFRFTAIVSLRMLQNITISNNQFSGTISKFGSLKSLKYLDLSCNMFRGSVPSGIENLRKLEFLNLSSNNLGGAIPSGFGNLEKLKYLDLQGNSFSGDVMNLFSQLVSVAYVDISRNNFSGSLDLALGKSSFVSSVQYLNVSGNSLEGQLFAHDGIPFFDSLEVFDASNNQLSGSVPLFTFVVSLKILRLQRNQFSGTLPQGLLQESSMVLSELDLSLNQLEGPVGSITSGTLKKLNLSSNKLSGSLPLKVGRCAIVDLSNNKISGNLSKIENWGNYVEVIRLSSNSLSGSLPNRTCQFLRLTSFEAANNTLQGVLPFVLGTYPELKVIDLSLNQLNHVLPGNIFTSAKLTDLNLSNNNFTGFLPLRDAKIVGNLSLTSINLSHNSLSGVLPKELGQFRNLVCLDLSYNKFEGNIPDDLSETLEVFNVSANNLSGNVPRNLRRFPESAFHPGNTLLIVPNYPSTPKDAADITLKKQRPPMKPSTKVSLIVGLVAGAVILTFVCVLVHYMVKKKHKKERVEEGIIEKKSAQKVESSHSQSSTPETKVEPPLSSPYISRDCDSGTSSSVVKEPSTPNDPKSTRKDEISSSPISLVSSATPSPSKIQSSPENTRCRQSPVKLAGDLYIFDSSLVLTPEELSRAPAEAIGRSCHGTMYRAVLNNDCVLAVKWLREGIAKSKKDFSREIKKLGNIKHPNLVSLQAYYWGPKEHEKLIISRYIDAPCLAHYLQETRPNLPPLSLISRLKIALDIAQCLSYLHNERAIPHGNLKSTNILLQPPDLTPLLTDYSLHRIITPAATAEQVLNAAALGYRPPEFASSSKPFPSLKSDVYAFGVILLEIFTGKSSGEIVSSDPGIVELTDWVLMLVGQNRATECFDQTLIESQDSSNLHRVLLEVLQVGLSCILPAPERPDMKSVFEELSRIVPQVRVSGGFL